MPITAIPQDWISVKLAEMQRRLDDLARSVGKPSDQVRDSNDNVVHMVPAATPTIAGRSQGVGLSFAAGAVTVTDELGRGTQPITASRFNGPVTGDTTGVHHGDVGTPTEAHNHYGDLHGNSFGFHYGPVGDGTTQNQINCLRIFHTGAYGNVGDPGAFFDIYGTVHAPSEGYLKVDAKPLNGAAGIVDAVPIATWQWHPDCSHADGYDHAGPMVEDVARVAPWLVRQADPEGPRLLSDRDLIGVLWAALREERQHTAALAVRVTQLESQARL